MCLRSVYSAQSRTVTKIRFQLSISVNIRPLPMQEEVSLLFRGYKIISVTAEQRADKKSQLTAHSSQSDYLSQFTGQETGVTHNPQPNPHLQSDIIHLRMRDVS